MCDGGTTRLRSLPAGSHTFVSLLHFVCPVETNNIQTATPEHVSLICLEQRLILQSGVHVFYFTPFFAQCALGDYHQTLYSLIMYLDDSNTAD